MPDSLDLGALVRGLGLHPILVDVGASAGPPAVWDPIAAASTYVGFDPDARDRPRDTGGRYGETFIIDRAVTPSDADSVRFYLTQSAHCSSTLAPDSASLAAYAFAPLFDVVSEVQVPAISLESALAKVLAPAADWIKLDTQGTDLRIFLGLRPETRARTLALDVEPGLIDAYKGEDLFADVHRELCASGFWLSRLDIGRTLRCTRATIDEMKRLEPAVTEWSITSRATLSPGWCEARYLRTPAAIAEAGLGAREQLLLTIFALLDEQWAFAFETLLGYEQAFESTPTSEALKAECLQRLREPAVSTMKVLARRVLPAGVRRRLRNVVHALGE